MSGPPSNTPVPPLPAAGAEGPTAAPSPADPVVHAPADDGAVAARTRINRVAVAWALLTFPLLLHLPLLLKNYWNSGKLDLLVLLPAWACIELWAHDEVTAEGRPWRSLTARLARDPLAWLLVAWLALYCVGMVRGAAYPAYGLVTAAVECLRIVTYAGLALAALRTLGPDRALLLLTYGLGIWVAANWALHLAGVGNALINLGRGNPAGVTSVGSNRILGVLGIHATCVKFPIGAAYAPIGLPLGLGAALAWHRLWSPVPRGHRIAAATVCLAAAAALVASDRLTALLGTVAAMVLPFFLRGRARRWGVALPGLALLVTLLGAWAAPAVLESYRAGDIGRGLFHLFTASRRSLIWHFYLTEAIPRDVGWLFGHGFYGYLAFGWQPLAAVIDDHTFYDSHSQYLDLVVNNGLVGAAAFLGAVHLALRRLAAHPAPLRRGLLAICIAVLVAGICKGVFTVYQQASAFLVTAAVVAGLAPFLPAGRGAEAEEAP